MARKRPKRNSVSRRPTAPTPEESLSPASEPTPVPILDGRITLVGEAARLIKRPEAAATLAALEHVGEILRLAKPTPSPEGWTAISANLQGLPIAWSPAQILAAKKKADSGQPVKWDVRDHTGKITTVEAPLFRQGTEARRRGRKRNVSEEEWRDYWAACTPEEREYSHEKHRQRLSVRLGRTILRSTIRRLRI